MLAWRRGAQLMVAIGWLVLGCGGAPLRRDPWADGETQVRELNAALRAANLSWVAGVNARFSSKDAVVNARLLMGAKPAPHGRAPLPVVARGDATPVPAAWNSITAFPHCPSLGDIWDQGACASCYVLATVQSASDRVCVATKGNLTVRLSAEHMLACCRTCGNGCAGGVPPYAWDFLSAHGVVRYAHSPLRTHTSAEAARLSWPAPPSCPRVSAHSRPRSCTLTSGGPYNDTSYCLRYQVPPCEHYQPRKKGPPCGKPATTPVCPLRYGYVCVLW